LAEIRPNVKVRYVFKAGEYHKVARKIGKADLVVALNCGFIFYRSWDESIPPMLKAPLAFTEYYEEDCKANLDKVRRRGKFLISN